MTDTIKDVATLTTIPEKTLMKLFQKFIYCICETILEDIQDEKEITELNIGLGTLYIKHDSNDIKYKFVPSNDLEKGINLTVTKKLNLMENTLNAVLAKKFMNVYKDLC